MASLPLLHMKCYSACQTTKNEVHEACGTSEGEQKYMQDFGGKMFTKEITL